MTKLETYRGIDTYYMRVSWHHALGEFNNARWLRVREWLVEHDPEYIWAN